MPLNEKPYLQSVSLDSSSDDEAGGYPFNIPAVRDVGKLRFHPDVTFFVGENGAGKSTVLEALALALGFSPEGGYAKLSVVDHFIDLGSASLPSAGAWLQASEGWLLPSRGELFQCRNVYGRSGVSRRVRRKVAPCKIAWRVFHGITDQKTSWQWPVPV